MDMARVARLLALIVIPFMLASGADAQTRAKPRPAVAARKTVTPVRKAPKAPPVEDDEERDDSDILADLAESAGLPVEDWRLDALNRPTVYSRYNNIDFSIHAYGCDLSSPGNCDDVQFEASFSAKDLHISKELLNKAINAWNRDVDDHFSEFSYVDGNGVPIGNSNYFINDAGDVLPNSLNDTLQLKRCAEGERNINKITNTPGSYVCKKLILINKDGFIFEKGNLIDRNGIPTLTSNIELDSLENGLRYDDVNLGRRSASRALFNKAVDIWKKELDAFMRSLRQ